MLLGLGLATLVPTSGQPAVVVGAADGVRVGGLLLQASGTPTRALLEWGEPGAPAYPGSADDPGFLHDVFARVGGPDTEPVSAEKMVRRTTRALPRPGACGRTSPPPAQAWQVLVRSGHVVIDNMWLWRADHTVGGGVVRGGANPCSTALHVSGDHVTAYGLAAEHTLSDLVLWEGEHGATYFYQSELPYDGTQAGLSQTPTPTLALTQTPTLTNRRSQAGFGDKGYAGYRVSPTVREHDAWGVGVYHYFPYAPVTVQSAIVAPEALVGRFVSPLSVYLNGNGTVLHVINSHGKPTDPTNGTGHAEYVCAR